MQPVLICITMSHLQSHKCLPLTHQFGPNGDVAIRRYGEAAVIQAKKLILPSEVSIGKVTLKQFIEATIREGLYVEGSLCRH